MPVYIRQWIAWFSMCIIIAMTLGIAGPLLMYTESPKGASLVWGTDLIYFYSFSWPLLSQTNDYPVEQFPERFFSHVGMYPLRAAGDIAFWMVLSAVVVSISPLYMHMRKWLRKRKEFTYGKQ